SAAQAGDAHRRQRSPTGGPRDAPAAPPHRSTHPTVQLGGRVGRQKPPRLPRPTVWPLTDCSMSGGGSGDLVRFWGGVEAGDGVVDKPLFHRAAIAPRVTVRLERLAVESSAELELS